MQCHYHVLPRCSSFLLFYKFSASLHFLGKLLRNSVVYMPVLQLLLENLDKFGNPNLWAKLFSYFRYPTTLFYKWEVVFHLEWRILMAFSQHMRDSVVFGMSCTTWCISHICPKNPFPGFTRNPFLSFMRHFMLQCLSPFPLRCLLLVLVQSLQNIQDIGHLCRQFKYAVPTQSKPYFSLRSILSQQFRYEVLEL